MPRSYSAQFPAPSFHIHQLAPKPQTPRKTSLTTPKTPGGSYSQAPDTPLSAKRTSRSQPSIASSLPIAYEGREFKLYSQNPPYSTTILLHYNPSDNFQQSLLGSFRIREPNNSLEEKESELDSNEPKEKIFNVQSITDVFVGKNCEEFFASIRPHIKEPIQIDNCFAVRLNTETTNNAVPTEYYFEAETENIRNAFLKAIQEIFDNRANQTKQKFTSSLATPYLSANATHSAILQRRQQKRTADSNYSLTSPSSKTILPMEENSPSTIIVPEQSKYETTELKQEELEAQKGNLSPANSPTTLDPPSTPSFTRTESRSISYSYPTEPLITSLIIASPVIPSPILESIDYVYDTQDNLHSISGPILPLAHIKVEDVSNSFSKSQYLTSIDLSNSLPVIPSEPVESPMMTSNSEPAYVGRLRTGFNMNLFREDGLAYRPVLIALDQEANKLGSLVFYRVKVRSNTELDLTPIYRLGVSHLTDVFLGKQSHLFQNSDSIPASASQCFTLATRSKTFNFAARSEADRNEFLDCIKQLFIDKGKPVADCRQMMNNIAATTPIPSAVIQQIALQKSQKIPTNISSAEKIYGSGNDNELTTAAFMQFQHGSIFTMFIAGNPRISTTVRLFYNQGKNASIGSLHWCNPSRREQIPGQELSILSISDVHLGKPNLLNRNVIGKSLNDNQCFSIVANGRNFHFAAKSEGSRNEWLINLRELEKCLATIQSLPISLPLLSSVTALTSLEPSSSYISTTSLSNQKHCLRTLLQESPELQSLREGRVLTLLTNEVLTKVFVFYEPSYGKMGTLFWSESGERSLEDRCSLPLHRVHTVTVGKACAEFKELVDTNVPSSLCFTLHTRAQAVSFIAINDDQKQDVLSNIKSIFMIAGKHVDERKTGTEDVMTAESSEFLLRRGYIVNVIQSENESQKKSIEMHFSLGTNSSNENYFGLSVKDTNPQLDTPASKEIYTQTFLLSTISELIIGIVDDKAFSDSKPLRILNSEHISFVDQYSDVVLHCIPERPNAKATLSRALMIYFQTHGNTV